VTVRVRFAPSPTGFLHVGAARTALYNWLWARHHGGVFILRSDDTDAERSEQRFADDIVEGLRWLGLDWDEGIEVGGPHAPYRESERLERYREAVAGLLESGDAYYDFATPDDLEAMRTAAAAAGSSPVYDGRFGVPLEEARRRMALGEPAPIRFRVARPGETVFTDLVRGEMRFDHANVDDFVILRSDGSPTYHLASTVDDVDFAITHVVRGEDLLSSTPKHILLTEALGAPRAGYAHLSVLQGPDGRKLSKRHGDTALHSYRAAGILPEAMVNYLALLGWSPGEDETIVDVATMQERFDLRTVSRNPAIFDPAKLEWMNGVYIRALAPDELLARTLALIEDDLGRALTPAELGTLDAVAPLVQERAKRLNDVPDQVRFLFVDEIPYDESSWVQVMATPEAGVALDGALARLTGIAKWTAPQIEAALRAMLEERGLSARKGLQPLRVAVSGSTVSPPLFESIEALGRERTLARIAAARGRL
jgi:glutamyl-tRNA synthetase